MALISVYAVRAAEHHASAREYYQQKQNETLRQSPANYAAWKRGEQDAKNIDLDRRALKR